MGRTTSSSSIVWSLLFVCLTRYVADGCDRVYVGSLDETYPELVQNNGIYHQIGADSRGFPVYRHEFRENYLYYIGGNLVSGFWAIGPEAAGTDAALSVQCSAPNPALAPRRWKLWDEGDHRWKPAPRLRAECVAPSFVTCTTGRLRLAGLSAYNHHQEDKMGEYVLTNRTEQMRPVYQHSDGEDFLFHLNGLWMIGPEVGRVTAGLFVQDSAWRPEYILEDWFVFNGQQLNREQTLRVTCEGFTGGEFPEIGDGQGQTPGNIEGTIPGNVPAPDPGPLPLCPNDWCYNGGSCIKNGNETYLCACTEDFFGVRCEEEINCGPAPEVEHGSVVGHSGSSHGAHTFYTCDVDYVMSGDLAVVCREDGDWSEPPTCEHRFHQITPSVPVRRRSDSHVFVRSHGGRRHKRNAQDIRWDVATLKAKALALA